MITKQQKFIEDNDIVGNSNHDKSKSQFLSQHFIFFNTKINLDLELFLEDGDDDADIDPQTDANNDEAFATENEGPHGRQSNMRQSNNGQKPLDNGGVDLQVQGVPVSNR